MNELRGQASRAGCNIILTNVSDRLFESVVLYGIPIQVAGSGLPSKTTRDQLHAKMAITSNYFITENDNSMNF